MSKFMKYIFTSLIIFQITLPTVKAETWSCTVRGINNEVGVIAYKRVGDHFQNSRHEHIKWQILFESHRVLVLSHLNIQEENEVAHVHGMLVDKAKMEGKLSMMTLWYEQPAANQVQKPRCTVSD